MAEPEPPTPPQGLPKPRKPFAGLARGGGQPEPAGRKPASPRGSGRYRNLILFWAVVLSLSVSGAVVVQALGPLSPGKKADAPRMAQLAAQAAPPKGLAAPDPTLQEPAPDFPGRFLPVAGQPGHSPAQTYAAPFDAADKHPRVGLVIAGLGLDQAQTLRLLSDLPPNIDIAFSPYTPEDVLDSLSAKARALGHECWQSIPMEPANFPLSEEGTRALLTGADSEQNHQNLEWALSRNPACVGATGASDGLFGERFAQTGLGFGVVLGEIGKRALLYLDPRTGAPALAQAPSGTYVADLIIDAPPGDDSPVTGDLIEQRLRVLEKLAAEHGNAIGLAGPPRQDLLERVAIWAHGLAARGIALAPVSAIPAPPVRPADTQP